jgi:ABC-type transport system involved in multi-copper enzyme maturation permease subunit
MLRVVKSELIRLKRPSFIVGGIGAMAAFGSIATAIGFAAAGKSGPGPGQYIPTGAALAAPDGFTAGLMLAANLIGIVALSFWAIAVASDYSTGLIRLLAQAEPRRWRLLVGKTVALVLYMLAGTLAATLAAYGTALACAPLFDVSTSAWGTGTLVTLAEAFRNLSLSAVVWGGIGLLVALLTRSSGVAIAAGVGYVVIFENMIVAVAEDAGTWLLGGTLTALAGGGTPAISFESAQQLGAAYFAAAILIAITVMHFREITY